MPTSCETGGCGGGVPLCRAVPAVVRIVLGALFLLAGVLKLRDPEFFALAITKFDLGFPDWLIAYLAHAVPWAEVFVGLLLVIGLWTRAAALLLAVMLAGFTVGIVSVIARGKAIDCGCFGALKLFCGDRPLGGCHIVRNGLFLAGALFLVVKGAGMLALDNRVTSSTPARR